jgi:hypothetical protein
MYMGHFNFSRCLCRPFGVSNRTPSVSITALIAVLQSNSVATLNRGQLFCIGFGYHLFISTRVSKHYFVFLPLLFFYGSCSTSLSSSESLAANAVILNGHGAANMAQMSFRLQLRAWTHIFFKGVEQGHFLWD